MVQPAFRMTLQNLIQLWKSLTGMSTDQPNPSNSTFRFLSKIILECLKWTIKTNHHTSITRLCKPKPKHVKYIVDSFILPIMKKIQYCLLTKGLISIQILYIFNPFNLSYMVGYGFPFRTPYWEEPSFKWREDFLT